MGQTAGYKKAIQIYSPQEEARISDVDAFLQRCKNKPFWLWGQKRHETWKYCVECKQRFEESATHCPYCVNEKWEKKKDYYLKHFVFPKRTLRWNDDLILNDIRRNEPLDCCFNHIVGLPQKEFQFPIAGKHWDSPADITKFTTEKHILPIFNWQRKLFDYFEAGQDNCIIKATGIGGSEFKLRHTGSKISSTYDYDGTQVMLIVGPQAGLANVMLKRFKDIFPFVIKNDKETCELANCWLHVFASRNIDSIRSLKNPKEEILEEFDYFPLNQMQDVFDTVSRYFAKSGLRINAISTVKRPFGYCYTIEHDPSDFHVLKLYYTAGLGTVFTLEGIRIQMEKFGFEREYNLVYSGGTGNWFNPDDIKACEAVYNLTPIKEATNIMAIDSGWATSFFAIIIATYLYGKIWILHCERHKNPDPDFMLNRVAELRRDFYIFKIVEDGADPQFIYRLKKRFLDYPPIIQGKQPNINNPFDYHHVPSDRYIDMKVIPTTFSRNVMPFLNADKTMLRNQSRPLKIHKQFKELFAALFEVYVEHGRYKKENGEFNDYTDCISEIIDFFTTKTELKF